MASAALGILWRLGRLLALRLIEPVQIQSQLSDVDRSTLLELE